LNAYQQPGNIEGRLVAFYVSVQKPNYKKLIRYISPERGKQVEMKWKLYPLSAPDTDKDFISDAEEKTLGTNPKKRDTDQDGLPDFVEVYGFDWVDYAHLGADPKQRDLFLEIDFHDYISEKGNHHDGRLSVSVQNKLKEFYKSLPIYTKFPDGYRTQGIAMHFIHDTSLTEKHQCYNGNGARGDHSPQNPYFKKTFRKLTVCVGEKERGHGRGNAPIAGRTLKIVTARTNSDPTDDMTEFAQFVSYRLIMHELGHSLGLQHGGNDEINDKPNYPSVMNYAYKWSLAKSKKALRDTKIGYSLGHVPTLNERKLSETNPFPGKTLEDLQFLKSYKIKYAVQKCQNNSSQVCVDWNGNGAIDKEPVAFNLRDKKAKQSDLKVLKDHNDMVRIENSLPKPLMKLDKKSQSKKRGKKRHKRRKP
jgi:hypothetical protein